MSGGAASSHAEPEDTAALSEPTSTSSPGASSMDVSSVTASGHLATKTLLCASHEVVGRLTRPSRE